ncbi:Hypothetical predicted protein, partial [Marmota monax]
TDCSGSVPECFLVPALIRASTECGAAEFRPPEPPWPRAGEPAEAASWSLLLSEHTPSTERPSSGSRNCPGPGLGAHGNCFLVQVLLRAGQDSPIALVARQGERNAAIRIGYPHGRDLMSSESRGGENFVNTSGNRNSWSPGRGGEAQTPESLSICRRARGEEPGRCQRPEQAQRLAGVVTA